MVIMLGYEWGGSPSTTFLPTPGAEPSSQHHHHPDNSQPNHPDRHRYFHPFNPQESLVPAPTGATFNHHQANNAFYDPRAYVVGPTPFNRQVSTPPPHPPPPQANSSSPSGYFFVPKAEEPGQTQAGSRIGLNLGGRTYFSSAEDEFVNRLYGRRSRPVMLTDQTGAARCQAESCNAELSLLKQYHRRHKVCDFHSKASIVIVHGLAQRFCQQCSRFHLLSEFDNGKRSCRKRLADHNRRRRKSNSQPSGTGTHQEISRNSPPLPPIQPEGAGNSPSDHLTMSPRESGVYQPSSAAVMLSPPGMSLDCFKQRLYHQAANTATTATGASSSSSSSFFFPTE